MPYDAPGHRHTAIATKAVNHGAPTVEDGFPGAANKTEQLDTFQDPALAAAKQIAIGEEFEITYTGVVEVVRSGPLAAADVGATIFIDPDDNVLALAQAGNNVKFGRVDSRDATRTPQVLRVSLDARSTF